jgi:SAM-dependent methyltransferase
MKTVVSIQDLLELEIKPNDLLAHFYQLTEESIREQLLSSSDFYSISCPACQSIEHEIAFEKLGFIYRQCRVCSSLYVSPRPTEKALTAYYLHSSASQFWRERILPTTELARREKIIQPRVQWVFDGLAEYVTDAQTGIDLSSYGYLFVQDLLQTSEKPLRLVAASPFAGVDFAHPLKSVKVLPSSLDDLGALSPVDFVTAFDMFDRCADLQVFVGSVYKVLRAGGLLFLTAPSVSGFDLQMLWDRSPHLTPPDRLNVLSIEGFANLFAAPKWEICELSTPGMLDVEAVRGVIHNDQTLPWHRFVRYLLEHRSNEAHVAFQEYLQKYRLSSFARLVVRKIK